MIGKSYRPGRGNVRIGLVGYGYSGRTFHAPLIRSVPGLELTLVGSGDADKVHADLPDVAVSADPMAVATSEAVDLVVIASPNDSHAPLALAALIAGKHVVVDKPFALDPGEARRLVATADHLGRMLTVFHNRRWDSDFLSVRKAIAERAVGTVRQFASHMDRFRPQVRDRWRERDGSGAGLLFDLGPHLIDQALLLFGPPDRVTADVARLRDGALTDDWFTVILAYPALRVVLQASMVAAGASPRFVVHGDEGTIMKDGTDRQERQLISGMSPTATGWGEDPDPLVVVGGAGHRRTIPASAGDQGRFYRELEAAMRGTMPNPVPPLQALAVTSCLAAASESARDRVSIVPDLTMRERSAFATGRHADPAAL